MSSAILFSKFCVISPDESGRIQVCPEGYVVVFKDRIVYVGGSREAALLSLREAAEEVGLSGVSYDEYNGRDRILLPCFSNSHSHLPMTLFRNRADDRAFHEWLFQCVFPMEERLRDEDVYYGSLLGIAEMVNSGIGASADMYMMSETRAAAALDAGFRLNICKEGVRRLPDGSRCVDAEGVLGFKKDYHGKGNGLLRTSMEVHSVYLYEKELYPSLGVLASEVDISVQVHVSETQREVEEAWRVFDCSPVEVLEGAGLLDQPCIAAHGVWLDDTDRQILASKNVTVVHNPASNLKLTSGFCDVVALEKAGVRVALGTDGCASNNNTDMFMEMRLASLLAKGGTMDATALSAECVLDMATRRGYLGMGFEDCGRLEAGMKADLQILNYACPAMWPLGNPVPALVYSGGISAVESVMINGRFVKYKGNLTTIDLEKVMRETKARSDYLAKG